MIQPLNPKSRKLKLKSLNSIALKSTSRSPLLNPKPDLQPGRNPPAGLFAALAGKPRLIDACRPRGAILTTVPRCGYPPDLRFPSRPATFPPWLYSPPLTPV